MEKKLDDSSNVRLAEQPKLKKKKPPAQVARDGSLRKAFWKRTKVARMLSADNWTAHYARLQETKSVAIPQVPVVSHPEKSGACFEPTFIDSEPKRHLTIEEGTVNTAKLQPDLNKLCAEEAES